MERQQQIKTLGKLARDLAESKRVADELNKKLKLDSLCNYLKGAINAAEHTITNLSAPPCECGGRKHAACETGWF